MGFGGLGEGKDGGVPADGDEMLICCVDEFTMLLGRTIVRNGKGTGRIVDTILVLIEQ